MASTNEKPKKSFMALYKAAIASPRHRFHVHESKPAINNNNNGHHKVETKSNISRNWLFMRKQKVVLENDSGGGDDSSKDVVAGENGGDFISSNNNGDVIRGAVAVEGRKSVSHFETNLGSVISFLQVKVMVSDMPNYMQVHAFRCARRTHDSLEKFRAKHMAYNIKKEFDKVHGPAWHCIVGSSFGSFVTHSTGCFLYFSMDKLYILLFKTKIQKVKD